MDDIEKKIELKNLEIKKMRLEQELLNLSKDNVIVNEPQKVVYTEPSKPPVNNPQGVQVFQVIGNLFKAAVYLCISFVCFYILYIMFIKGSASSTSPSTSTSSSSYENSVGTNVCGICGKSFSGYGYYTAMGEVHQSNSSSSMNYYCSYSCANKELQQVNRNRGY